MSAQIVSFHCVLKNKFGQVLGSTFNNEVLTAENAPSGQILKGLVDGLKDLKKGERRSIALTASQAYGFYDLNKVIAVPRGQVPAEKRFLGAKFSCSIDGGSKATMRVVEMDGIEITLDGNHPLAGQDLVFEIEAIEARDATADDLPETDGDLLH